MTEQTPEMWRSKLGTNYPKEFMEENEARLLHELQALKDLPENQVCADCGVRGTLWASVNLGVFLCMTCGAHHRSLGTHVSLPKGCVGTYWWGPDEIQHMRQHGNARAKELYGGGSPPQGLKKEDALKWKEYLTDKYVHKKYVKATTASFTAPLSPISPRNKNTKLHHKRMPNIDFVHFGDHSPPHSPKGVVTSPLTTKPMPGSPHQNNKSEENFFAEFGL